MNKKLVLAGIVFGFLCGIIILQSTSTLTGFAIFTNTHTTNFRQSYNESTTIELALPPSISSLTLTGSYEGTEDVSIVLVTNTSNHTIARYTVPTQTSNRTLILEEEGKIIELTSGEEISFRHVFIDACEETCKGDYTGPFSLDIKVNEGTFTLTSLTYSVPELFTQVQPTEPTQEETQDTQPECTSDATCGSDRICHNAYCVAQTGHYNITDQNGRTVALFDKFGRVLLAGAVYESQTGEAPTDAFRVQDKTNTIAWITEEGDLYIRGQLRTMVSTFPTATGDEFSLANTQQTVVMFDGTTGDMYTAQDVVANALQ